MGIYIQAEAVKLRLAGRVRFTDDPTVDGEEHKMPIALLNRLISEAESQVETDLSPRYAAPFQTPEGKAFSNLPQRPTKDQIQTLCELQSVVRVLETSFGSSGPVDSDKYAAATSKRYKAMVDVLLELREREKKSYNTFKLPPLPGLRLNYMNEEADTGFAGRAFGDSRFSNGDYPAEQINSPAETFWNGTLDVDDG